MMARYLCYLFDSGKVVETDDPSRLDELHICTETEFDDTIADFMETTIEDIALDEFDVGEFCAELFDESVECTEHGCYTTDDVLNAMCSDIWEEMAYDMGLLDDEDCIEEDEWWEEDD